MCWELGSIRPAGALSLERSGTDFGVAVMQGDGNVLVHNLGAKPVRNSGTTDHPGNHLVVQNGGSMVISGPATRRAAEIKVIPAAKHRGDVGASRLVGSRNDRLTAEYAEVLS
jgi:hypothetical protein